MSLLEASAHLNMDISQLIALHRQPGGSVQHLHANGSPALGFQLVTRQILGSEGAHTAPVQCLPTQAAGGVQAAKTPVSKQEGNSGLVLQSLCAGMHETLLQEYLVVQGPQL